MRRRVAITSIITLALLAFPVAGHAEAAPLPVKMAQIKLGSDQLPAHQKPGTPRAADSAEGGPEYAVESAEATTGPFDMVGVTWEGEFNHSTEGEGPAGSEDPTNASAWIRTSADGERWSDWSSLTSEVDQPDPGTDEGRNSHPGAGPAYVGDAEHIQIRWDPGAKNRSLPTVHLIDTKGKSASLGAKIGSVIRGIFSTPPAPAHASSGMPPITMRPAWGADESWRRADPGYGSVRAGLVHHTVTPNGYSCSDSASIVRGIYSFHVFGNGWNDIGYNFLIDACGQIFEGRYGGVDRPVIGAHAENFNYATTGASMIGTFTSVGMPGAMYNSLVSLEDWKLDLHGVNPLWQSTITAYDGSSTKTIRNVSGHRDVNSTSCPGDGVYGALNSVATDAYNGGGQKIFAPGASPNIVSWNGTKFGPTTIAGNLKYSQPWVIRIFDSAGGEVRSYTGNGNYASATWDGNADINAAVLEGPYSWRIESGDARPSIGYLELQGGHRFQEYLLAYNPLTADADVTITLMSNLGVVATPVLHVPANSRQTLDINKVRPWTELSARADSTGPVLMERSMYFNYQGSMDDGDAGFGAPAPATDWYFGEGYTGPGFYEYLTLQNPGDNPVTATIEYMFNPNGTQIATQQLAPHTRATIDVNSAVGPNREVAAHVTADGPIVAERPMYYNFQGQEGGDNALGANAPATEWNFAEGYTGQGFTTFVTLANPGAVDANATLTFFGNGGILNTTSKTVKAGGRTTVTVNALVGNGKDVSTKVTSDQPIVAERPVYFGYQEGRDGGHVALGNTSLQTHYDFAEGYTGTGFDEWLTVLNPDPSPLTVNATYAFNSAAPLPKIYVIPGNTRQTIAVHQEVNRIGDVSVSLDGNHPFAVERPMYFTFRGTWRGGSDAQGGPIPGTTWYFAEGYTG